MSLDTGENPHVCEIYNRGFSQKGDQNQHLRTHTNEKKDPETHTDEKKHVTEDFQ